MTDPVFHSEPELSPSDIETLTGLSPATLRDWRHRGYIEGLGTIQTNGRWKYDWLDALILFVYREVSECGMDISTVRLWAEHVARLVTYRKLMRLGYRISHPRYYQFSKHREFAKNYYGEIESGEKWAGYPVEELGAQTPPVPASVLIDCEDLSSRLPSGFDEVYGALLKDLLREQKEQGLD